MTFMSQIITSLCNFLLSGVLLNAFGSVLFGITSSINQFLSYISLLEGGVGRVGRAEMYKPLAEEDSYGVSRVYYALKRFFFGVGIICIAYIFFLSIAYYDIAGIDTTYSRKYIFVLVWILGLVTISKYLGGLTNLCLLVADQKQYIGNTIIAVTTVLGVIFALLFVKLGADLLYIKLIISMAYVIRPVAYAIYVKKRYALPKVGKDYSKLEQKWSGIWQNIAFYLHSNTDIVLLTFFADIRLVAVYSVYSLVISNIRLIAITFSSGMEGALGAVYSSGEKNLLKQTYMKYQMGMFFVVSVLFGSTAVLILPFVKLYTVNAADVNYIQPLFALFFLMAEASECVMHPCNTLAVSANQIRETRGAYYWEVILNLTISIALIWWNPLLGLMLGTFTAVFVKNIFFAVYAAKKILEIKIIEIMKPLLLVYLELITAMGIGMVLWSIGNIETPWQWILWAVLVVIGMLIMTLSVSMIFYPKDVKLFLGKKLCGKKF